MLAFAAWYAFSSIYTASESFWLRKSLTLALDVLAFIVPLVCFRTAAHFRGFNLALLALAMGIVLVVFAFYASGNINFLLRQGFDKETSKIPDYLTLGTVLGIGVLVALARPTVINLLIALAAMGSMLILAARGPILFVVLMIAASYFLYRRRPRSGRVGLFAYLLVLAALGVAVAQWTGAEATVTRFTKIFEGGRDLEQGLRFEEFTVALRVIGESPLLGVGLGGYGRAGYGLDGNVYPHNLFLEAFAEAGVVGFLLFGGSLLVAATLALRRRGIAAPLFVLLSFMVLNYMKSGGFVSARDLFMLLGVFLAGINVRALDPVTPFASFPVPAAPPRAASA
jgi:O-antigen ligase